MMNIFQGDNIEDVDHNGVIPRSSIQAPGWAQCLRRKQLLTKGAMLLGSGRW